MSTTIETTTDDVELPEKHVSSEAVSYKFNVTDENKTENIVVNLGEAKKMELKEIVVNSPQFRSDGQLINDALTFYLDGNGATRAVHEIVENVYWDSSERMSAAITPTLFYEIESLVNHPHTDWNTKQEFYICALATYSKQGMPPVIRR